MAGFLIQQYIHSSTHINKNAAAYSKAQVYLPANYIEIEDIVNYCRHRVSSTFIFLWRPDLPEVI